MDDLSRSEYPAILASLQPGQAVHLLQERVKRIGKLNQEIADWLQERRKVEEQYVAGLKKLTTFKVPNPSSELGVFQLSWDAILRSIDTIASSHHLYCERIEKDVENPLRTFQGKKEMSNINNISGNLQAMAKELEEAQSRADKLSKKGGKANTQKVDTATSQLESATQQWESQAPFVFETLQALDEQRVNHLRDVLTQLETHEVDQAQRTQQTAEAMLNLILEIKTEDEIQNFAQKATAGRPKIERRSNTRQSSIAGSTTGGPPLPSQSSSVPAVPPLPQQSTQSSATHEDTVSEHSGGRNEPPPESKLRSRIGTMLGRRRQSIHGGFGPLSPSKSSGPFSRNTASSHGRAISPRASSHNLAESNHRLSSLAETPDSPLPPSTAETRAKTPREGTTNGISGSASGEAAAAGAAGAAAGAGIGAANISALNGLSADEIFGVPPPPGPPPSQQNAAAEAAPAPAKDAEGFSVPPAANDPISQAQRDAAAAAGEAGEAEDHAFKVNIQNEPVDEEDAAAKQAALSNVANALSSGLAMPSRKAGTVRGRRDVRNTIYVPAPPLPETQSSSSPAIPRSPTLASTPSRPSAVAALASEASLAGTSDSQSVRSATSLASLAHLKHPDSTNPGLNTSIIETVSARFEDGELKEARIAGEIAFSYNATEDSPAKETETIRINNFPLLEAIGPNRIFVQPTPAADEFALQTAHLQAKPTVAFTFRAHAEDATALAAHCPLVIKPVWKPTGDKLGLLLQYRLHPAAAARFAGGGSVTLRNVVFIATYEGARASGVQTKPSGTHLKDKHIVYWRLSEVNLTEAWSKIVCRVVGEQGAEPQPGHVDARWEYTVPASAAAGEGAATPSIGITVSHLQSDDSGKGKDKAAEEEEQDPFADESVPSPRTTATGGNWTDVPLVRQIVSGKYEAK